MESSNSFDKLSISNKDIILISVAIILYVLCANVNKLNKNIKFIDMPLIKIIILAGIAYCAYNNYIEITVAGFALYLMLEYQNMNNDINEAMLNFNEIKKIEHFTNMIN